MLNISKILLTSLRAHQQKSAKSDPLTFCYVHPDSVESVFRFCYLNLLISLKVNKQKSEHEKENNNNKNNNKTKKRLRP